MRRITVVLIAAAAMAITVATAACSSEEGRVNQPGDEQVDEISLSPAAAARPTDPPPLPADARPLIKDNGFRPVPGFVTDTTRSTIRSDEVISGGPPKDGIPAVDNPVFESIPDASEWIGEDEPVFVVTADGETRIYPVQILTYHEIVNDTVGNTPVSVTFCPLCNTGLTFKREFNDQVLDFGTTGRLRLSNLIMYDRQTETWWQQATGEGLVGLYAGFTLELYPMLMLPWDRAIARYPDAQVLSRDTGHARPYGNNPYAGYDTSSRPFLYDGPRTPGPFTAMDRVLEIVEGAESFAVPYPVLQEQGLVQRDVGGSPIVVFWEAGTASALDTRSIADGRDVGSANAFRATVNGQTLSFAVDGDLFRDRETGTLWDATGRAVDGDLSGTQLEPAVGVQHFWFSHSAFAVDGRWTPLE